MSTICTLTYLNYAMLNWAKVGAFQALHLLFPQHKLNLVLAVVMEFVQFQNCKETKRKTKTKTKTKTKKKPKD